MLRIWTFGPLIFSFCSSARGRLEGNLDGTLDLLSGPVAPDPVLYPECYSARTPTQRPRIGLNAKHILERGQRGVVGDLLKLDTVCLTPVPNQSRCNWSFKAVNLRLSRNKKYGVTLTFVCKFCISWPLLEQQRVHDFGKQNVRRLREIQRRCKEQEAVKAQSRPVPVKALWTSSKYQNVPSRLMVQLQVRKMSTEDKVLEV